MNNKEYYYDCKKVPIDISMKFLKEANPDVEIRGRKSIIITSKPIEKLNSSFTIETLNIKENLTSLSTEEYQKRFEKTKPFIFSKASEKNAKKFVKSLRKHNPNININLVYDHKNKNGKITSNVPLYELKFPRFSIHILDKDGNIGIGFDLNTLYNGPIINYKLEKNNDNNYKCIKILSRYYENLSLKNKKKTFDTIDNKNEKLKENNKIEIKQKIDNRNEIEKNLEIDKKSNKEKLEQIKNKLKEYKEKKDNTLDEIILEYDKKNKSNDNTNYIVDEIILEYERKNKLIDNTYTVDEIIWKYEKKRK